MVVSLSDPLTLPCGATLPNRIAKAALTEGLATPDGIPTPQLERLYRLWADGGAGLLITGNVIVDRHHLERPGNVVLDNFTCAAGDDYHDMMTALKRWAAAATRRHQCHCWVQLSHAGRQTKKAVNPHPKAPSAVPLALPGGQFGTPVSLTAPEIEQLVERFAVAARTCQVAGFTGVQIHAAHGYLLSQFLSPKVNGSRTDEYGGALLENRARFLLQVVRKVRQEVGPHFPIAVKLNSADFQKGGFDFQDSLQVVQWLEAASVDLVEISGGTYEQPALLNVEGLEPRQEQQLSTGASTQAREAYFVDFAKAMQSTIQIPLMVTGGFRTRAAMEWALESGAADVIGLGRPLCVLTNAPQQLLQQPNPLQVLPRYEDNLHLLPTWMGFLKRRLPLLKVVDGFASIYWFYEQLEQLGQTGRTNPNLRVWQASLAVEARSARLLRQRSAASTGSREVDVHMDHEQGARITYYTTAALVVGISAAFLLQRCRPSR